MDLNQRPRRLRTTAAIRDLVRETAVSPTDLMQPLFVVEGYGIRREIAAMPGVFHLSVDQLPRELERIAQAGVRSVMFFGIPDHKDMTGSAAWQTDGVVQRALRTAKSSLPEMILAADICLCEYTSHGHCGIIHEGRILNDPTVELLCRVANSCVEAGADILAPSDMMDGRIGAMRKALDAQGFEDRILMSYSVKHASAFYGPFREAAGSAPSFGDRKSYQMDPANAREALREAALDVAEGADILMVKPAMSSLDLIRAVSERFDVPVAAYRVSGEYAMIKAAAQKGWLDERNAVMESVTAIRRAGAKIIITYDTVDIAKWCRGEGAGPLPGSCSCASSPARVAEAHPERVSAAGALPAALPSATGFPTPDSLAGDFHEAESCIPGGVNSPVRAFRAVGVTPPFIRSATGCRLTDEQGNAYVDYIGSWGPMILGHAHPEVVRAISEAAGKGTSYGVPTWREVEMAKCLCAAVPSMDMVRMVSSGTEAVMSAIRLARGFTGRQHVVKFAGCYHGHSDGLLVKSGSGALTLGVPDSAGVPAGVAQYTLNARYNDLDSVRECFAAHGADIACILVEPVAGNMGVVLPEPGFLQGLRDMADQHGALLIFDEVITGFRASYGGAQQLFGIRPDLTTLGKIVGGGLPVGAYGGRRDIMSCVSPLGPVYQAGTLSGNPVAMAAGLAVLSGLRDHTEVYGQLDVLTARLANAMKQAAEEVGIPLCVNRMGSLMTAFFQEGPVRNLEDAMRSDTAQYAVFFRSMMAQGILLPPSQFEAWFVSAAHGAQDVDQTEAAIHVAMKEVALAVSGNEWKNSGEGES